MNRGRAPTDSTGDPRAIRQALMRLEQAWNAQDAASLKTLFTSAATVIDVHHEADGVGMFPPPSNGQIDAPAYSAISVQQIVPLSKALVYAAFSVQMHLYTYETLSISNRDCVAVLEQDAASGEWKIRLLHFV